VDLPDTGSPPPGLLVTGHFHQYPPYAVFRRHGSGNWLITYTIAGQGLYRQPGLSLEASPGDIVLLGPDAFHDYCVPPGGMWEFTWAHFHPRPAWHIWWNLPQVGSGLYLLRLGDAAIQERVRDVFLRLHADAVRDVDTEQSMFQRELALNGLEEVLLLALREHERQVSSRLDVRVQAVIDIMTADLAAPHDLASLAAAVALSPSRLVHLFKAEVGESVMQTLLTLRLRQASRLLEFTPRSIAAISEEVGFSSPFYFSRVFRQHFGANPQAYRATLRKALPVSGADR
jgi:AraC family transcriptional regulator of arabinose operon